MDREDDRPDLKVGKKGRRSSEAAAGSREMGEDEDGLRFEDPFSDEEEEDEIEMEEEDGEGDGDEDMMDEEGYDAEGKKKVQFEVYVPGKDNIPGDELEVDNSAYEMLHRMNVEWPLLSFDFLRDNQGQQRTKFPMTAFAVGGTEADAAEKNKLILMRMTQLHRTKHDDADDSNSDDSEGGEDDLDDDPELQHVSVSHVGSVNRVRSMPQEPGIIASWSGQKKVHIWDLRECYRALEQAPTTVPTTHACDPAFTIARHKDEGFAMDWSPVVRGQFASGDSDSKIYRAAPSEAGVWALDDAPYKGHTASVEDIQWSPTEAEVFASCSVDRTVRIWDGRRKQGSALSVEAADTDVNVISWNKKVPYLLASGDDAGNFRVWDLRSFQPGAQPVASFAWHNAPITSVEWHPDQPSVIAASAADNQVTIWDMSLERDAEAEAEMVSEGLPVPEIPAQLIFIHQGQKEIKEMHWHPQCPGVLGSTAANGFNVFRTINSA